MALNKVDARPDDLFQNNHGRLGAALGYSLARFALRITVLAFIREKMLIETALVFIFGLLWGSFANVVIYRYPKGESVVLPRSRCPQCKNPIAWYDNIPVISWLVLRGRCRKCGGRISWRYPLVELLTGFLFAAVFYCVTLGAPSHVG